METVMALWDFTNGFLQVPLSAAKSHLKAEKRENTHGCTSRVQASSSIASNSGKCDCLKAELSWVSAWLTNGTSVLVFRYLFGIKFTGRMQPPTFNWCRLLRRRRAYSKAAAVCLSCYVYHWKTPVSSAQLWYLYIPFLNHLIWKLIGWCQFYTICSDGSQMNISGFVNAEQHLHINPHIWTICNYLKEPLSVLDINQRPDLWFTAAISQILKIAPF